MILKIRNLTKHEITTLINEHESYASIARSLGFSETGGSIRDFKIHAKKLDVDTSKIDNNWSKYISSATIKKVSYDELLVTGSTRRINSYYKKRMIRDGLLKNECYECGLKPTWNGKKLTLQIEHGNGNHYDNRIENLSLLCPNCHSQTTTHSVAKNIPTRPLNKCIDCGGKILNYSTRCNKCASILQSVDRIVFKISKDELAELIKTKSYRQISIDHGISDKTVKKWCIKYELV